MIGKTRPDDTCPTGDPLPQQLSMDESMRYPDRWKAVRYSGWGYHHVKRRYMTLRDNAQCKEDFEPQQLPKAKSMRYLGRWKVVRHSGLGYHEVEIQSTALKGNAQGKEDFELAIRAASGDETRHLLRHDGETDTLFSEDIEVAFWRKPSHDMIFATARDSADGQAIWTARRRRDKTVESPGGGKDVFTPPGETWKVTMSSAVNGGPMPDYYVRLRQPNAHDKGLYTLHLVGEAVPYDVLRYDKELDALSSDYGLRSIKYSKRQGKGRLVATFDSLIPTGHKLTLGKGSLIGEPMPFEKNPSDVPRDDGGDIQQDPDAGCWCAEPDAT